MKARLFPLFFLIAALIGCRWSAPVGPASTQPAPSPTHANTQTSPPGSPTVPVPTRIILASPSPIPTATLTAQPAFAWPRSTPEEQGVSSATLAAMLEKIQQENRPIHSILVIRHGVLVLEAYAHPFDAQTRHGVYSVTKSVTSALVGIAQAGGKLAVDAPVIDSFPSIEPDDPRKKSIRIENLLAMNSGIEWTEPLYSGLNDHWSILEADDPARYFFERALIEEPGAVFNYNSGGSHLLSILVQNATGQPAVDFAAANLFSPLGIRDFGWLDDFTGHTQGGTGLELLPVDMAKIGQVYLNGGKWQGRQIVPAEWVKTSTRAHSAPSTGMGYGYQWWIRPQGDYYALGWGGQQIRVFPEKDMLAVISAGMSGEGILHNDLVDTYLLPAATSNNALAANPQAKTRLDTAVRALATPRKGTSAALSPLAREVDGKQWLVTGMGNWSMFTLHFSDNTTARLELELDKDPVTLSVGLDGVYRVTGTPDYGPIAMRGYWEAPDTFVLEQQNLREADRRTTRLQFAGNDVKLFSQWFVEPHQEESEAVLFK